MTLSVAPQNILKLKRTVFTDKSTMGELYLPDFTKFCHTLEDVVRDRKIPNQTCIPSGKYEIICSWSNRFQRIMPRLMRVPYFDGILIHSGNTPENTSGCILIGFKKTETAVYESLLAFEALFPIIRKITDKGKLFIDIEGGVPADQWKTQLNLNV